MAGFRASVRRRVLTASRFEKGMSSDRWLTTFNDLVTLLMVFFVLLFSMSSIDVNRLKYFKSELQAGLGILNAGRKVNVAVVDADSPGKMRAEDGRRPQSAPNPAKDAAAADLERTVKTLAAQNNIRAEFNKSGVSITLENELLFPVGSAALQPDAYPVLGQIADILRRVQNDVRIEGHTDNLPIHSNRFPTNWELSAARAVHVLKHFTDVERLAPARFSAVGYGDSRPLYPNDTPTHRSKNRRVEIVLVTHTGGNYVE